MKRIAVLTSGGDAPGMNAAIRAVVNQAHHHGIETYGVYNGFKGLVNGDLKLLNIADCDEHFQRGGTFLRSARFPEFKEKEIQLQAIEQMKQHGIDALVVIGGDGSFTGALKLVEHGFPAVGIPGTIDNDIPGTEYTIGFDTAVNVALESIDKIMDTAASHNRTFVVEVMGRDAGDIAIWTGVACGADAIIIPEDPMPLDEIAKRVMFGREVGKNRPMIILAEGAMSAEEFMKQYREIAPDQDVRAVTLAHVQRGGNPTVRDRVLATAMGVKAVDLLVEGQAGLFVGIRDEKIVSFDIIDTLQNVYHKARLDLYELNKGMTER